MFRSSILLLIACAATGCSSVQSSHTARTATEQLLISNAVDQSLSKVDFGGFANRKVFVEEKYMDSVDKAYVLGTIRHRLMMTGAKLTDKKEDSEFTIEVRSGSVGTDANEMFVGIPEITLPGMLTLPEVRLVNRNSQSGTAKLGLVAYDTVSGDVIGDGGLSLAQSDRNDWFVFGMGPYQNGTLNSELRTADLQQSMTPSKPLPNYVAFNAEGYRPAPIEGAEPKQFHLTGEEKPVPK